MASRIQIGKTVNSKLDVREEKRINTKLVRKKVLVFILVRKDTERSQEQKQEPTIADVLRG
jgi:hypothetical protein